MNIRLSLADCGTQTRKTVLQIIELLTEWAEKNKRTIESIEVGLGGKDFARDVNITVLAQSLANKTVFHKITHTHQLRLAVSPNAQGAVDELSKKIEEAFSAIETSPR